jgi:hypothetical protein
MPDPGSVQPSSSWHGPLDTLLFMGCQLNYLRASPKTK